jgi:hypothetical protein
MSVCRQIATLVVICEKSNAEYSGIHWRVSSSSILFWMSSGEEDFTQSYSTASSLLGGHRLVARKTMVQCIFSQATFLVLLLIFGVAHLRPQLFGVLSEYIPALEWFRTRIGGLLDPSGVGKPGIPKDGLKKQQTVLVAKLAAIKARVYGSMHCTWTRQQLEVIGIDTSSELFIDCDKDGSLCSNVQAFPTWTISGRTEPGFLPIESLSMIADGVLMASYKEQTMLDPTKKEEVVGPSPSPRRVLLKSVPEEAPAAAVVIPAEIKDGRQSEIRVEIEDDIVDESADVVEGEIGVLDTIAQDSSPPAEDVHLAESTSELTLQAADASDTESMD